MDERENQPEEKGFKKQRLEEVNLGEEIVVLMRKGRENSVIGRLADGRVILPSKESTVQINPGDTMIGDVVHATGTYIIVMPKKVLGDTTEALLLNLKNVADSGYYQHAVLAKALIVLLEHNLPRKTK